MHTNNQFLNTTGPYKQVVQQDIQPDYMGGGSVHQM